MTAHTSAHTLSAIQRYLNSRPAARYMALLKKRSITRITITASASAAVRCESRFRNFTGGHSFAMYRISVTFRPPPAGVFTVVSPSQTITADLPPSKL